MSGSGSLSKRIEIAANVAIIMVALVAVTALVKRNLVGDKTPPPPSPDARTRAQPHEPLRPVPGSKVSLPDVDWAASKQTFVLALAKGCHFCSESAPFYQKLLREIGEHADTRLIALFPRGSATEAKEYLDEIGVSISEVREASLEAIGTRGTPTLVLVDNTGSVKESWLGRLQEDKELEVLSKVKCDACD